MKILKNLILELTDFLLKKLIILVINLFEFFFKYILLRNKKINSQELKKIIDLRFENLKNNYDFNINPFLKKYQKIDKKFILDLAYTTQVMYKKSEINIDHGRILYAIVSDYISLNSIENLTIVEIGTAKGFSAICMAKALFDNKYPGKIYTFDIIDHSQKVYWNNIYDLNGKTSRRELLTKWEELVSKYIIFISGCSHLNLKRIFFNRIHFAFIDGSHYGHDIEYEFNIISKFQKVGDIIFFDDYNNHNYQSLTLKIDQLCLNLNYSKKIITGKNNRDYLLATKIK